MGSTLVIRSARVRARQRIGMKVMALVLKLTSAQRLIKISQGRRVIEKDVLRHGTAYDKLQLQGMRRQ